jgi:hypothetical protein
MATDYFANITAVIEQLREDAKTFLDGDLADTPTEALALAFDNLADNIDEDDEPLMSATQLAGLRTACGIDVKVRLEGSYTNDDKYDREIWVLVPGDDEDMDEWWQEEVFPETGADVTGSYCKATVIEGPAALVGQSTEWMEG